MWVLLIRVFIARLRNSEHGFSSQTGIDESAGRGVSVGVVVGGVVVLASVAGGVAVGCLFSAAGVAGVGAAVAASFLAKPTGLCYPFP